MADVYNSHSELEAVEILGLDYRIVILKQSRKIIIVAPHAGGIEVGTSELTTALSDGFGFSRYMFEGLKPNVNGILHITSTNFDEPNALQELPEHKIALSVHGYSDSTNKHTIVGGLDFKLREMVVQALISAGFSASVATDRFTATDPDNIVNRCATGKGVQLEISTAQRKAFFANNDWSKANRGNVTEEFNRYVKALGDLYSQIVI
ncbi:poly-gamma-glutamate hydrolase family protein [Bacillus subtilis]|uniref:Poly-gamma-glutamate hydrolase n=1 Tax=Bacillus phage vB_BsuS_PJN02 TaxID=2920374 RepID=A0AC61TS21_9CAUD|nr:MULTISPECIES: poly-gamma-glutamate hydrolase family protein [Bacillus subtilis group]YP_010681767.1 poly-gamma-glutamate hydrolase [Bacillus phage vB_BsuS_PJN02]MCR4362071.1 poly-gamma-glutamate hydrolase family protein [Bacillus subtilis]UNH58492.1 poly-gamma-glutamate hydrolase [Bacillus phage vB_BsuS_PJN02]UQB84316.1 poly-gamma-glutamate hydrolase family protein [Bacillus amyloliquefaciens]WOF32949.1 poly-gamma-glutamate hydrolase family protein [Bacillus subtilis]